MVNRQIQRGGFLLAGVVGLLVMSLLLGSEAAQAQVANSPWPKFGQNVRNTGQSPFGGVGASWQSVTGAAQTGPAIAADGTIYIGASSSFGNDSLYAINPADGSAEWFFAPSDFNIRSVQPVIGGDGTIYVGGNSSDGGLLYAVRPDGSQRWDFFTSETIQTAPVLGSDGTVYVMSSDFQTGSQFFALDPSSGQPAWSVNIGYSNASPTIASDGTIYVGTNDGGIFAIDPVAEEAVQLQTALSGGISGIAIGSGGILYITFGSNQLAAVDPSSDTLLWSASADLFSITAPALGPNGRIFFGVGGEVDGAIYAFDTNGNELWSVATNGLIEAAPAVGNDGRLYVGIDDFTASDLVALDPADGSLIWAFGAGGSLNYPLALAADGTVYAGTGNGLASVIGPEIALSPPTLDFGTVGVGFSTTQEATIENTGDANLNITGVSVAGSNASAFAIESGGGSGTLAPGATRTVTVAFSPSSAGDKSATLTATSTTGSASTTLVGTGVDAPSATTNPPTDVGATGATLNGTVNPNGAETTVIFEYGLTTDYGSTATADQSPLPASTGSQAVSAAITDLEPGTTYHYRVVASNTAGETAGGDQTFTTGAAPPSAITEAATEVAGRTATLNGTINPGGAETTVTFEYGVTPEYGNSITAVGSPFTGTVDRSVSAEVAELQPGTTYHFRVVATNGAGEDVGEDRTFTTGTAAPLAATDPASEVTATGATLNGTVGPGGLETTVTFEYGLTPEYGSTIAAEQSPLSGTREQPVSAALAELQPGTTYHYRVISSNSAGESVGDDQTFTTAATVPIATTDPASSIAATSATLNGAVNPNGAETTVIFEYGLTTDYGSTIAAEQSPLSGTGEQAVSAALAELQPGTTYHYRVVATNGAGEDVGDDQVFTTESAPPVVTTEEAANVSAFGATLNGLVEPGGAETTVNFEYQQVAGGEVQTVSAGQSPVSGAQPVKVNAVVEGLNPDTEYVFRVVAENRAGRGVGEDQTFTTSALGLSVTPSEISFGEIEIGSSSDPQVVTLQNTGDAPLTLVTVNLSGGGGFTKVSDTGEDSLQPGETRTVEVVFSPKGAGTQAGELVVESRGVDQKVVALSGTGVTLSIGIQPSTLDFGSVAVGSTKTRSIRLSNTGSGTLELNDFSIEGSDAALFSIEGGGGAGGLEPGENRAVIIEFLPSSVGSKTATLVISSNAGSGSAGLTGAGTAAPLAATDPASEVTATGATLNGTVGPGGLETTVTFEYGLTPEYGSTIAAEQSPLSGTEEQAVSAEITDLEPGTTYHYRVIASNSAGESVGDDQTFTTAATTPTATTDPASSIAATSATLNGAVNPNGAETTVTFEYGLTIDYGSTITADQSPLSGTGEQPVSAALAELQPGTTYHYRVIASNEAGEAVGDDRTFTTETAPPSVTTDPASDLSESSATLNGTVNPNGAETTVTFEYGVTPEYGNTITAAQSPLSGTEEQAVSAEITDLEPGTTYHYRVVASNTAGETAGDDQTFTTRAPVLSVTPSALSFGQLSVEDTSDTQSVQIENTGDADLVLSGVALSSTDHFAIRSDTEESTLAPGAVRTVDVAFAPASGGVHSATLDIESNAGNAGVDLSGRGVSVDVSPPSPTLDVTGEPEEITVTASEGFEVQTGFLYFRRGGEQAYDRVPLTPESANQFTAALPGSAITERGVDLYAELTDGTLTATFPAQNPAGNPLHLRTQTASLPAEGAFTAETYRMISVPVVPGSSDPLAVLDEYGDYEPQRWRLLRWDPQAGDEGSYRELEANQEFPALETPLAPGAAFWLITRDGESFSVENAQSTDGAEPFSIQLRPGFNQIANPFAFPVSWSQVEAPSGVDAPRAAFDPHETVSVLEPWQGYWIFNRNSTPVQIAVPPVEAGADALAASKQAGEADLPFEVRPAYALQLSARLDTEGEAAALRDRHNYVGWSDRATAYFGAEDVPEVPPIGSHVRLSVVEDGTRLAGSLRPAGMDGHTWDLAVTAQVEEPFFRRKTVTVRLRDHGTRPADYQLQLIDRDHDRALPIQNNRFTVTLTPEHPTRHLRLVMGTPDFTEQEAAGVVPRTTALGAGYPNPARDAVSFDYQLSEERRVLIAVYDVLGRRMQTLIDREQPAGNHSVRWDGRQSNGTRAASGVYIVRMQAGSFSATRRIVLVR